MPPNKTPSLHYTKISFTPEGTVQPTLKITYDFDDTNNTGSCPLCGNKGVNHIKNIQKNRRRWRSPEIKEAEKIILKILLAKKFQGIFLNLLLQLYHLSNLARQARCVQLTLIGLRQLAMNHLS